MTIDNLVAAFILFETVAMSAVIAAMITRKAPTGNARAVGVIMCAIAVGTFVAGNLNAMNILGVSEGSAIVAAPMQIVAGAAFGTMYGRRHPRKAGFTMTSSVPGFWAKVADGRRIMRGVLPSRKQQ